MATSLCFLVDKAWQSNHQLLNQANKIKSKFVNKYQLQNRCIVLTAASGKVF